ncbi:MAG: trypsin-like peptidase domain-containing protein [Geminicoccaceae bacterium]
MAKIVVRHVSGSKQNQIEQFELDAFSQLSIGRDPSSNVVYDAIKDDLVSRRHALIEVAREPKLAFIITDRGSANGTFVNGRRLTGSTEIGLGDRVTLGQDGPSFVLDLEPRPVPSTRLMVQGSTHSPAHVVIQPPEGMPPAQAGIGHATFERKVEERLVEERRRSSRRGAYALAAGVVLLGIAGFGLYQLNRQAELSVAAALEDTQARMSEADQKLAEAQQALLRKAGRYSRQEIAAKAAASTVFIETTWRLYDRASGRPLFHRCRTVGDACLPLFVRLRDGSLERWLTIDDENKSNRPITSTGRGTGFVVSKDGFILTNKHVASGWLVASGAGAFDVDAAQALVVSYGDRWSSARAASPSEREQITRLRRSWVPIDGAPLFLATRAELAPGNPTLFEGRADILEVRFPGTSGAVAARFIRASNEADVALIKIDVPQELPRLELAADDYLPPLGEPITVIGYPAASDQTISVQESNQGGVMHTAMELIPEPTVADGVLSRIGTTSGALASNPGVTTYGRLGDVYQLSATAIGPGSSGGPVLSSAGKVIGLLTYLVSGGHGERISYAVPIKYGNRIMNLTRITQ